MGVLLVFWFSLEKPIKPIKTNPTVKKPSKKQIKPKKQCFETYVAYGGRMCKESLPDIGFMVFPRETNKTNVWQAFLAHSTPICRISLKTWFLLVLLVFLGKTKKNNKTNVWQAPC